MEAQRRQSLGRRLAGAYKAEEIDYSKNRQETYEGMGSMIQALGLDYGGRRSKNIEIVGDQSNPSFAQDIYRNIKGGLSVLMAKLRNNNMQLAGMKPFDQARVMVGLNAYRKEVEARTVQFREGIVSKMQQIGFSKDEIAGTLDYLNAQTAPSLAGNLEKLKAFAETYDVYDRAARGEK